MFQFSALPPLSVYIHFPWCVQKCPYCDFNSHALKSQLPERDYIEALLRDVESELPRIWGRKVTSVFMGGGTPSLFSAESLSYLLSSLRALLALKPDVEITLEANPGTVEQGRFQEYLEVGINRLSIGVQSFANPQLQALGRIHDRDAAIKAAERAHAAGFENFNLDLMFGLPAQDLDTAMADVKTALTLEPAHISYYQLTLEPNTEFHHRPPPLPGDDVICDMQEHGQSLLSESGYQQYEVSAYARQNKRCKHNLNYWQFGDYLGIGAGAHDKITDVPSQRITRRWKRKHPQDYLKTAGTPDCIGGERHLSTEDAAFEFMLNALRLTDGIASQLFSERTGLPISVITEQLTFAEQRGWIEWDRFQLKPTATGQKFLNDLVGLFLPADA
jgi:oxygen-independent coproporphyrinogen-3 oxidase